MKLAGKRVYRMCRKTKITRFCGYSIFWLYKCFKSSPRFEPAFDKKDQIRYIVMT